MKIEEALYQCCLAKKLQLGFAESCTGGALAAAMTSIAGISDVFLGSVVAYSNLAKKRSLSVSEALLEKNGPVSEPVAKSMMEGVLTLWNCDLALSTTGIAGPSGGTKDTPVGTVFVAIGGKNLSARVERLMFKGGREAIVQQTVVYCLQMLLQQARGI